MKEVSARGFCHPPEPAPLPIPLAARSGTFSRHANGMRANQGLPAFTPTPLALGLNVEKSHSWPYEV